MSDMSVFTFVDNSVVSASVSSTSLVSTPSHLRRTVGKKIKAVKSSTVKPLFYAYQKNQHAAWEALGERRKNKLDAIIKTQNCMKGAKYAAEVWCNNYWNLEAAGVTLPILSYRTGIYLKTLQQAVLNRKEEIKVMDTPYTASQIALLDKIVPKGAISIEQGAKLWHENFVALTLEGITRNAFGYRCRINFSSLRTAVYHYERAQQNIKKSVDPIMLMQKIILHDSCLNDERNTSAAWVFNKAILTNNNVSLEMFAQQCRVNLQPVIEKVAYLEKEARTLNEQHQHMMNSVVNVKMSNIDKEEAGKLWLANEDKFRKIGLTRGIFAQHCKMSKSNLDRGIVQEKQKRVPLSLSQLKIVTQIIQKTRCHGNINKTVTAYITHQDILDQNQISASTFAHKSNVGLNVFHDRYAYQSKAHIKLTERQSLILSQMPDVLLAHNDVRVLAKLYLSNKELLSKENITQAIFAKYHDIKYLSLKAWVHKLKKRELSLPLALAQPRAIDNLLHTGEPDIKKEAAALNWGIPVLTLDAEGVLVDESISNVPRLADAVQINNSLPLIRAPNVPDVSLTLQALGMQTIDDLKGLKINNWGGLHEVFNQQTLAERNALKKKLLDEIREQIINETMQAERMSKLMVSKGSHYQSTGSEEIIDLGQGVMNPGSTPVPVHTVLGIYGGELYDSTASQTRIKKIGSLNSLAYSWGAQNDKFDVDSFLSGNILRNINTGNLPNKPWMAENNVAAVQINGRLIAYVTRRDIAPNEEYFVDYGEQYNPADAFDTARREERVLKLYQDNRAQLALMSITLAHLNNHYSVNLQEKSPAPLTKQKGKLNRLSLAAQRWLDTHPLEDITMKQEAVEADTPAVSTNFIDTLLPDVPGFKVTPAYIAQHMFDKSKRSPERPPRFNV
ncbi:SET domain-containing protein [Rouxiella sp. T17]|uniref:SET domain-containing protein n=1 Tax=Rouxiella sp. T17 TaxID=3085684 RepID=UPI002FC65142